VADRLYIHEIQQELQYRDRRSVRSWCRNNNVRVLSDAGSNKQFVLKAEYEKAKNHFKSPEALSSAMKFFSQYQVASKGKEANYKPQGKYEKEFLKRIGLA
jgi:hypothetical protein